MGNMLKNHLLSFVKMHALGNDFIVIDFRDSSFILTPTLRENITNRRLGIGADQLITLHRPLAEGADVAIEVTNSDGSVSGAWGNGTRCVANLIFREKGKKSATIETLSGLYKTKIIGGEVALRFDNPMFDWDKIPLTEEVNTLEAPIDLGPLKHPTILSLSTPHMIFFTTKVDHIPLDYLGSHLEHHPFFAKRTNVEIVECYSENKLRVRVWERGTGITPGCGSGASAAALAAIRRGFCKEGTEIECVLDGGTLTVIYENNVLWLKGGVATVFTGVLDLGVWS